MKKILCYLSLAVIFLIVVLANIFSNDNSLIGPTFAMTVDGVSTNTLDSNFRYYLTSYTCQGTTKLSWNHDTQKLTVSGTNTAQERCYLNFESAPFLTKMKVGSYVSYTANNGCNAANTCIGKNVNDADEASVYGYCGTADFKYTATGWRIGYISNDKVYLISAGAPECLARSSSTGNADFISNANGAAIKYCNSDFVTGCNNTNIWAMKDNDFNKIAKAVFNSDFHLNSYYGSSSCNDVSSSYNCGYADDMFDIGGYYWFAASADASSTSGVLWDASGRKVTTSSATDAYGIRIVIALNTSIKVTGGTGTPDNPYIIISS